MLAGVWSLLVAAVLSPSILISGGTLIDGSGSPGRSLDVRIRGDQIVEIGVLSPIAGEEVVDATGFVVAPGFIDAHSHADRGLEDDPTAISQLTQGITTAVVGQDGYWRAPVKQALGMLKQLRPPLNYATFSGHGGIRTMVMGEDYKRPATETEIRAMEALVQSDMAQGSLGLSTGLEYDPGYYASTGEVVRLAQVAREWGGIYISHVRDESDRAFEAFDELVRISLEAKIPAQISHIKLGTAAVWGKANRWDSVGIQEGVTADVYPYLYWQSGLSALSPSRDWDNPEIWVRGLADIGGAKNVRLTRYAGNQGWEGKTLAQIAELTGKTAVALIQEILRSKSSHSVVVTAMTEPDLQHFIKSPRVMFCSDGSIGGSHPRGAGSFPRILGLYVRELKILPIEEAIRKMTSFPAERLQLGSRGRVKPGFIADLVVFDPATVQDHATPENPVALSTGVRDVMVNGKWSLRRGKAISNSNGQTIIRHITH